MPHAPDVAFGAVEPARFETRLSRFHGTATRRDSGAEVLVHIPNSGRLAEVLRPGAPIAIRPRSGRQRRTSHDLALVAVAEHEQSPRAAGTPEGEALRRWWGEDAPRVWASVDARLPPRIITAAAARGAIPGLRGATLLQTEPKLGVGRADLLFEVPGRRWPVLVEAKSTTLVRDGIGLFPDSPTVRGAAQVAALARDRRPGMVVIVCQRPDADAVAVNAAVDGRFASTIADAVAMGVVVLAGVCTVSTDGVGWRGTVPVHGLGGGIDRRWRPEDVR